MGVRSWARRATSKVVALFDEKWPDLPPRLAFDDSRWRPLTVGNAMPTVPFMTKFEPTVPAYLISLRRSLCERLEAAEKGHPKPDLVKKIEAEIDAFDAKHPRVRGAR